jgi:hypothetical protein
MKNLSRNNWSSGWDVQLKHGVWLLPTWLWGSRLHLLERLSTKFFVCISHTQEPGYHSNITATFHIKKKCSQFVTINYSIRIIDTCYKYYEAEFFHCFRGFSSFFFPPFLVDNLWPVSGVLSTCSFMFIFFYKFCSLGIYSSLQFIVSYIVWKDVLCSAPHEMHLCWYQPSLISYFYCPWSMATT